MKDLVNPYKILLKIATKNKFDKFMSVWADYFSKVQDKENFHFLISLENDDESVSVFLDKLKNLTNTTVVFSNSKSKIDAVNRDIDEFSKLNSWDILIVASIDSVPTQIGFDQAIREKFYEAGTTDIALFFNDGFSGKKLNTIPILGRKYYERFGYVYSNDYTSFFCEKEYTEIGKKLEKLLYFEDPIIKRNFAFPNFEESKSQVNEIDRNTFEKRKKRLGIPKVLTPEYKKDFQYPAITEKQALFNHLNIFQEKQTQFIDIYIGFPWAALIDDLISCISSDSDLKRLSEISHKIKHFNELAKADNKQLRVHTVCQHIKWRNLIDLFVDLGINNLYVSHCVKDLKHDKIQIHPWSLVAANFENNSSNIGLNIINPRKKQLFFSFIGNHCHNYRSEIRLNIKNTVDKNNFENIFFILENRWFFEDIVYKEQLKNVPLGDSFYQEIKKRTRHYNTVLSNSLFSLCPEGSGPNTIRLWESMSVGTIPVLFENDWNPPAIPKLNLAWDDISITIPKNETENFCDILKEIKMDKIEEMQINCINAYNQFRLMTCFD